MLSVKSLTVSPEVIPPILTVGAVSRSGVPDGLINEMLFGAFVIAVLSVKTIEFLLLLQSKSTHEESNNNNDNCSDGANTFICKNFDN